ncbi:MAG: AAA family ATPase [Phenylobacterium sp.]
MLIVLSGRPGVGKSAIARVLAARLGAVWLRIDSIEAAIMGSGRAPDDLEDLGYRVAYAVAVDNLALGRTVVADCVNDVPGTREAWREAAGAHPLLEVEVVCSDEAEHRRRVESRISDIPGLKLPTWADIQANTPEPWDREVLVVDTARMSVDAAVESLAAALS